VKLITASLLTMASSPVARWRLVMSYHAAW
jgi:hypothetical protein